MANVMIHKDHDLSDPNILKRPQYFLRRSPIFVTISDTRIAHVDLQKMMKVGMNAIKFETFAYTKGQTIVLLSEVDKATAILGKKFGFQHWPCTTCMELTTCIVKTGMLEINYDFITLEEDSTVTLMYDLDQFNKCNANQIFVNNPYIGVDAVVGMNLNLLEGDVEMRCVQIVNSTTIKCVVTKTGILTNMNVLTVRGGKNTRPVLENKDLQSIRFAITYQIDMIIINFCRRAETLVQIKKHIGTVQGHRRPILIAGICSNEEIQNIDEIIKEADGILFSRGYLAFQLGASFWNHMLIIQKWINAKCLQAGKPFYISGVFDQALTTGKFVDSESADVTNSLIDGASGFMLKSCRDVETLIAVIKALNQLCCTVEPLTNRKTDFWRLLEGKSVPITAAQACAVSCAAVAHQNNSKIIIVPTVTGDTAKILMWLRPASLVLTVSSNLVTSRRLQSCRCVISLIYKSKPEKSWEKIVKAKVQFALRYAMKMGWMDLGDYYVTLQRGADSSAFCDTVRSWSVTEEDVAYANMCTP